MMHDAGALPVIGMVDVSRAWVLALSEQKLPVLGHVRQACQSLICELTQQQGF